MSVLITGAAGYIGSTLSSELARKGVHVHALVRAPGKNKLLQHPKIIECKGDVLDKGSLLSAMQECCQVYHTAAKVGAWSKDASDFYAVNVNGTDNVFAAAMEAGIEKIVYTSTSGVLGPAADRPIDEEAVRETPFRIDYDISKGDSEEVVRGYVAKGVNAVIVSPSKVFGPGATSHSMTANAIIEKFLKNKIAFIPSPGNQQLCFAYLDDVVNGHILSMKSGVRGEKYILGGNNITYYHFFDSLRSVAAIKARIVPLPKRVIKLWAYLQEINHRVTGAPVQFPVKSVDHVFSNYIFSSEKAIKDLGYSITGLEAALHSTIHFLKLK